MSRMNGKKTHTHTLHASSFPLQENDNFYPEGKEDIPGPNIVLEKYKYRSENQNWKIKNHKSKFD